MDEPGGNGGTIETELTRDLGLVSALAIGVGTMIAAGIFTLSGLAVGYVGSAAIVSFLAAAVVALFTALTYCEFTSIYPQSGEGYLYARRTFPGLIAYMVGWCLLLGYTASCGFYIASLSSYFNDFIWHAPFEMTAGLVVVALLTLLNMKGTKESGTFQVVITVGKVLLLMWFITGGVIHVDPQQIVDRFSTDIGKIGSTAAMVFITFFGFSAIAASAGEVKNPTKTIPRAIFLSMGIVTVLYSLVVLVIVAANLTEYSESSMGTAAKMYLGPIGGMVIVLGALFSMISASNASILAGSRVALSMSQLGHLPRHIGIISKRRKTPVVALLVVGAGIATFGVLLPLEDLAHFADCVLLIALVFVNAALIQHRRRYPHLKRPFKVPLVPVVPVLGILANVYLLAQIPHLLPIGLALIALAIGFVAFMGWKGAEVEEAALPGAPSRVALEQSDAAEGRFQVMLPVVATAHLDALVDVGCAIAKRHQGRLVVVRVVVMPEQLPPQSEESYLERERPVLDQARKRAREQGVPVTTIIRVGHSAARAILETGRERMVNLIVLGWKGHTSTARRILGEVTDEVVTRARTDVMLVKLTGKPLPKRLLLPTAGGIHARQAEAYAADLAASLGGHLTLCTVVPTDAPEELLESETTRLEAAKAVIREASPLTDDDIDHVIVKNQSVKDAIVKEAAGYDGIVVGAAGQSYSTQILFGSIPEDLARESDSTVIVIKHHHRVKALLGRVMSE